MKAYLLSYQYRKNTRGFTTHYILVYAFTFEQAKEMLLKKDGWEIDKDSVINQTIEYTI